MFFRTSNGRIWEQITEDDFILAIAPYFQNIPLVLDEMKNSNAVVVDNTYRYKFVSKDYLKRNPDNMYTRKV